MSQPDSFYVRTGENEFVSTELTRGPWDPGAQHAGPPTALIGQQIAAHGGAERASWNLGRLTCEILAPVPIAPLRVDVEVIRSGRSVELLEATVFEAHLRTERPLIRARAWRLRDAEVELPPQLDSRSVQSPAHLAGRPSGGSGQPEGPQGIEAASSGDFFAGAGDVGYHTGVECRFVLGSFDTPGAATVWMRLRQPLIEGEELDPLTRVLAVADSGNGVSSTLDIKTHLFINVDLTVNLHRLPSGDWVCLDSLTIPDRRGIGLSDSSLFDQDGPIGRATQALLVAAR